MSEQTNLKTLYEIVAREALHGVAGPVDEKKIDQAEKLLNLPVRGSYREFIKQIGDVNDAGFSGLRPEDAVDEVGIVALTELGREDYDLNENWIMIYADFESGEIGILDTSQMNEEEESPFYMMNIDPLGMDPGHTNLEKYADTFAEAVMKYFGISPDDLT